MYQDKSYELDRLVRKFLATKGMVNEIIMKCRLLKGRLQAERREGNTTPSYELIEAVTNSMPKYQDDLSKYRKQMRRIKRQVEELCH